MTDTASTDVAVVGGGLAGLTAAAYLARAGVDVTLFERASAVGGRAATHVTGGYHFNLGPHALYRKAEGSEVLRELEVSYTGGVPGASGGFAVRAGVKHALPGGFMSLLTTGLLGARAKIETARLLASIGQIDAAAAAGQTVRQWLDASIRAPEVRELVQALFRLTTYANEPHRQSAGSAIAQLQEALSGNVMYLDGGWQTLIEGLRRRALEKGAKIVTGRRVDAVEQSGAGAALRFGDGTALRAGVVVLAVAPAEAAAMAPGSRQLAAWAREAVAVRAACLEVALRTLPQPRATFALGIDEPLYLSVHSAVARLAPDGGALIHTAKYLPAGEADARADETQLEGLLDLVQPGWRDVVVERRFLPRMIVFNALPTAAQGGIAGRPGPAIADFTNLYVAGDWVGQRGMLADASLASARATAAAILERRRQGALAA
jgi:phytoene dehydrogenase-like protein